MSGMILIHRAVSTGNGAAARRGRPCKLTTVTACLVKDVINFVFQGKVQKQ